MMVIKRKKIKSIRLLRLVGMTLILVMAMVFAFKTPASGSLKKPYTEITVSAGDTLWEIAKKNNQGENIQETIYYIMKANNMERSNIYPGQLLKIPLK